MTHCLVRKPERGTQKIGGIAEKHTGVTEKRIWLCVCEEIQRGGQKMHILQSGTHGAGQLDTTAIIIRYYLSLCVIYQYCYIELLFI